MTEMKLFISSVQKEMVIERHAVRDFISSNPLLSLYFKTFLFEDLPASDRQVDEVYLQEVDRCSVYIGIFGNEYGFEDEYGISPTEKEYKQATNLGKTRLIFVKGTDDNERHPKMLNLIKLAGRELIRRRFNDIYQLTEQINASLVEYLHNSGFLRISSFDASVCNRATMADLSTDKLKWFLSIAQQQRQYKLAINTPIAEAISHLNLLDGELPTHSAILLFGNNPQQFLPTSEVKCMHYHGIEVRKPIPSYQIFKGTVFELVDQSVDFVLSKISRHVGMREHGTQADVEYELPRAAVIEAIVNAIAHRDYSNNASVQIMLFSDRLEIWNPGELLPPLTMEQLRKSHPSVPRNPRIAEPMFLARYIEKAGTGTLDMIAQFRDAKLPEPEFRQEGGMFVQTLWRDWLTSDVLNSLNLNDRQIKGILEVKSKGKIGNSAYQALTEATKKTATRDLEDLTEKAILVRVGNGRGTHYILNLKRDIKETKETFSNTTIENNNGDIKGTKGT